MSGEYWRDLTPVFENESPAKIITLALMKAPGEPLAHWLEFTVRKLTGCGYDDHLWDDLAEQIYRDAQLESELRELSIAF